MEGKMITVPGLRKLTKEEARAYYDGFVTRDMLEVGFKILAESGAVEFPAGHDKLTIKEIFVEMMLAKEFPSGQ